MSNEPEFLKDSEGIGAKYLVQAMLGHLGAEVNQPNGPQKMWFTAVINSVSSRGYLSVVKELLSQGVCVNTYDEDHRTPLHYAAKSGQMSVAQYLITQGALVNMVQVDGCTSLHCATDSGHLEMCEYLLKEGAEINKADVRGRTVLHAAAGSKHLPLVDLFLQHGSDITKTTKNGETALHIAVEGGKLEIVKKLVEAGTRLELETIEGNTAFFVSIFKAQIEVACYLIDMGAELSTKNTLRTSPVYWALLSANGSPEGSVPLLNLLVEAGADLQQEDWLRATDQRASVLLPILSKHHLWLRDLVREPRTLKFSCCIIIRKHLHKPVSQNVASLGLPDELKDLIGLKQIFCDIKQFCRDKSGY